jgi:hypothetical protein
MVSYCLSKNLEVFDKAQDSPVTKPTTKVKYRVKIQQFDNEFLVTRLLKATSKLPAGTSWFNFKFFHETSSA